MKSIETKAQTALEQEHTYSQGHEWESEISKQFVGHDQPTNRTGNHTSNQE